MANVPWTEAELATLHRTDLTLRELAATLGRSYNAVIIKRRRLGIAPLPTDSAESRKTHCPQGHAYDGDNVLVDRQGHRRCVTCKRAKERHQGGCNRCKAGTPHEFTHGTSTGHNYHSCRCAACKSWARDSGMRAYWANRERHLEGKKRQRERNLDVHRAREREKASKPETAAARRRRQDRLNRVPVTRSRNWTPHEKALVLREDLSVLELAYMLQRHPSTVQAQRDYLRRADEILQRNRAWRERSYPACTQCGQLLRPTRKHKCGMHCANGHPRADHERRTPGGKVYCVVCKNEYNKAHPKPRRPARFITCENCAVEYRAGNSRSRFCSQKCGDAHRYAKHKEMSA